METRDFHVEGGASVPLLVSATIPASFRHGFTTRAGGVSAAPYATLNLGSKWGDSPDKVAENRRRLLVASGARAMFAVSQVHGTRVVRVAAGDDPEAVRAEEADGLCGDGAGLGLSAHVADCSDRRSAHRSVCGAARGLAWDRGGRGDGRRGGAD
jgi:hypothetical protein